MLALATHFSSWIVRRPHVSCLTWIRDICVLYCSLPPHHIARAPFYSMWKSFYVVFVLEMCVMHIFFTCATGITQQISLINAHYFNIHFSLIWSYCWWKTVENLSLVKNGAWFWWWASWWESCPHGEDGRPTDTSRQALWGRLMRMCSFVS